MSSGISLHLGLNRLDTAHYAGWDGALRFCVSDARAMQQIVAAQGFETRCLFDADATRTAVKSAIRSAASELSDGDLFVLSFAGHGGQVRDFSNDDEDLLDETWCLFDGQMLDDELYGFWHDFEPGVRIVVVSDSCHSGTVTRDVSFERQLRNQYLHDSRIEDPATSLRFRYMPRETATNVYFRNRVFYRNLGSITRPPGTTCLTTVLLLAACRDDQVAAERGNHGVFTQALVDTWDQRQFTGNYRDFMNAISAVLPCNQTPVLTSLGPRGDKLIGERPFTI